MRNILFIITKSKVGGAQKFVKEQIQICQEDGYTCYLATNKSGWVNEVSNVDHDHCFFSRGIEKSFSISFLYSLIQFLIKNKIALVVCNSANGGLYGRIGAFLSLKKSIYVSHGWSSVYNGGKWTKVLNFIETILAYMGSSVLCISTGDVLKAKEFIFVPKRKLIQINNAVFPVIAKGSKLNSLNDNTNLKLLTVCRLSRPKRLDLLIESMNVITNIDLYIVGDGPEKEELEKSVSPEMKKRIIFLGEIQNFTSFSDFDFFTLISDSEGLPMSAIEAMSAGLPLILSNVGGCPELVKDNGFLTENNVQDISKNIEQCANDIKGYSKNSSIFFNKSFNLEIRKIDFLNLYSKYIE